MTRRPIFWGIMGALFGLTGWFISVIGVVVTLGAFKPLANAFGVLMIASVPIGILGELVVWWRRR